MKRHLAILRESKFDQIKSCDQISGDQKSGDQKSGDQKSGDQKSALD